MDYEKNEKYFKITKISGKTIAIAVIVAVVLLIAKPIVGIIAFALIGVYLYMKFSGVPSDSEIDNICTKEIDTIKQKALDKIGLDEDEVKIIDPIIISGYDFDNSLTKKGKDNHWRSSKYEAIVLFFSEKEIYSYSYKFSIIENKQNQKTEEYFYKDIVSVSTSSDSIVVNDVSGNSQNINIEAFRLTTSGGTSITCSMRDYNQVEKSIQGMKQLLREKKSA